MTSGYPTLRARVRLLTLGLVALVALCGGRAEASCFTTAASRLLPSKPLVAPGAPAAALPDDPSSVDASFAGLWQVEFLLPNGDPFDHTFQQVHSDGTEMMLSRGLPPALGNVCIGIWKQTAQRTIQLLHVAWNWDANGNYISTFVLQAQFQLDRRGRAYSGTWSADNLDPATGAPIPAEHFDGTITATKIGFN
jgi:hypothetical protein